METNNCEWADAVGYAARLPASALAPKPTAPARPSIKIHLLPKSGFALAVLANLIWGTSFLTSKYTLNVWGPFTASALRFAIALAGMLLILPALGLSID